MRKGIRTNEKSGNYEYVRYAASGDTGRVVKVLMKGLSFTDRNDMEQMIKGYEGTSHDKS